MLKKICYKRRIECEKITSILWGEKFDEETKRKRNKNIHKIVTYFLQKSARIK